MSTTTNKTKRPRISKGTLVTSSNDTTHNVIQALKRVKKAIVVIYHPISYNVRSYNFVSA